MRAENDTPQSGVPQDNTCPMTTMTELIRSGVPGFRPTWSCSHSATQRLPSRLDVEMAAHHARLHAVTRGGVSLRRGRHHPLVAEPHAAARTVKATVGDSHTRCLLWPFRFRRFWLGALPLPTGVNAAGPCRNQYWLRFKGELQCRLTLA